MPELASGIRFAYFFLSILFESFERKVVRACVLLLAVVATAPRVILAVPRCWWLLLRAAARL